MYASKSLCHIQSVLPQKKILRIIQDNDVLSKFNDCGRADFFSV